MYTTRSHPTKRFSRYTIRHVGDKTSSRRPRYGDMECHFRQDEARGIAPTEWWFRTRDNRFGVSNAPIHPLRQPSSTRPYSSEPERSSDGSSLAAAQHQSPTKTNVSSRELKYIIHSESTNTVFFCLYNSTTKTYFTRHHCWVFFGISQFTHCAR